MSNSPSACLSTHSQTYASGKSVTDKTANVISGANGNKHGGFHHLAQTANLGHRLPACLGCHLNFDDITIFLVIACPESLPSCRSHDSSGGKKVQQEAGIRNGGLSLWTQSIRRSI